MTCQKEGYISFDTSGSTGSPLSWWRTKSQLVLEGKVVGEKIPMAKSFLSFAAPHHLFGAVFGSCIPDQRNIACHHVHDIIAPVAFPNVDSLLIVCVPSTWSVLPRHIARLKRYKTLSFVHGAGPLPVVANRMLSALPQSKLVEVFGSTEAGGIAIRHWTATGTPDWELLPDVDILAPSRRGELVICSPRLASRIPGETRQRHACGDIVRRSGTRAFEFLGRTDRTIKLDGRRINLDAIDAQISQLIEKKVASIPIVDVRWGTHFDIYVEGGTTMDADEIRGHLIHQPRMIHFSHRIPSTASGKTDFQELIRDTVSMKTKDHK